MSLSASLAASSSIIFACMFIICICIVLTGNKYLLTYLLKIIQQKNSSYEAEVQNIKQRQTFIQSAVHHIYGMQFSY